MASAPTDRTGDCEVHVSVLDGVYIRRTYDSFKLQQLQDSAGEGCRVCRLLCDALGAFTDLQSHSVVTNDGQFSKRRFAMKTVAFTSRVLELYALPGASMPPALAHCPVASNVPKRQDSEQSLHRVRQWLDACTIDHVQCGRGTPDVERLPTRLVDVGCAETSYRVRLIETETEAAVRKSPPLEARYVALSHCWGASRPACLTTPDTLETNKKEIPWESLAKTYQDAIIVTRTLGVRYIWIDTIAIIQMDKEDWVKEAGRMKEYYSNAYCTIAATWGEDDDCGLFCDRDERYDPKTLSFQAADGSDYSIQARWQTPHFTVQIPDWYRSGAMDFGRFPLLSRAWVYQERLLSKRFLHFTQHEIIWECMETSTCQCYSADSAFPEPGSQPSYDDSSYPKKTYEKVLRSLRDGNTSQLAREWRDVAVAYSRLSLTFGTDKFPALSGINTDILEALLRGIEARASSDGEAVTPTIHYSYISDGQDDFSSPVGRSNTVRRRLLDRSSFDGGSVAGLLRSDIMCQLLWCIQQYPSKRASRPKQWRAPSWSWASVDSPIQYVDPLHEKGLERELATYLGKSVTTEVRDSPFGELKAAEIRLKGKAIKTTFGAAMNRTVHTLDFAAEFEQIRPYADFMVDFNMYPKDKWTIGIGDPLLILAIGASGDKGFGLVLEKKRDEDSAFMRVGAVSMNWEIMEKCLEAVHEEQEFLVK